MIKVVFGIFWIWGIFGIFGFLESLEIGWFLWLFFVVGILFFFAFGIVGFLFFEGFCPLGITKITPQNGPNMAPKWPKHDTNLTLKPYPNLSKDDPRLPLKGSLLNRDPYVCIHLYKNLFNIYSKHRQHILKTYTKRTKYTQHTIHSHLKETQP